MARSLRPPLTGIGRYTLNVARGLSRLLSPGSLTLFVTRDAASLDGVSCARVSAPLPTPHELLRGLWEQTLVPLDVRRRGIELYHSPSYSLPLSLPCPSVVTIHDLAFLDARFHKLRMRFYLRILTQLSLRRADHVIAVSQYTREQLEARCPHVSGRISVVYPGLDPLFSSPPSEAAVREFRQGVGQARPYILFVGAIEPRKNIPRLIRAYELAIAETGLPDDLVLCGPLAWRYGPAVRAWRESPLRDRIRHTGYVPAEQLPLWYAGADLLLYPSLCEGFGFPPLEAMASGTPVVTSDCSSLPEVVADAAITVPPTSVEAIAEAIRDVLTKRDLADDLRAQGLQRALKFTWGEAAAKTLEIYRQLVSE